MPIVQENPTYFSDKPATASSLNRGTSLKSNQRQQQPRCGISTIGASRKLSVTSYEDTEDGSEMETFLSSCESNNSYNSSDINTTSSLRGLARNNSHRSCTSSNGTSSINGYSHGSLKRNIKKQPSALSPEIHEQPNHNQLKSSGLSSLTRLGQLFKKSKSKLSVGSESHASTIESSGIGSPTCTPDSSLSIYTNSLDGDSHSSSNSNQISPKHSEESMEDKFCSTYAFDDCGIFAANMYYNVGEPSVFTIYHQHSNSHANGGNNSSGRPLVHPSRGADKDNGKVAYSVGAVSDRDDEFEDCVQPYYNNTTFSTFPNPKRCSVASAASTTTSSVVPVQIAQVNENKTESVSCITGKSPATEQPTHPILHDRDGYLKPNEPRNLRNVKNLYINDSVIANANRNGQVQQVQVDVHTPTSSSLKFAVNRSGSSLPFSETSNSGGGAFSSSAASSGANSESRYHFDSAGSSTSAATTLVAGGSNNFLCELPEDENADEKNKSCRSNRTGPLPVYMNRAYFGSNSILPTTTNAIASPSPHQYKPHHPRISPASVAADCEPYCSLCASSIMGSPRQRSKMDVAIVKCKECFFSREAETHLRGFFDKLMKAEDKQKMDVTLKSYDLNDLDHPTDRVVVHSAKVQIVIISHHFLQRLKDEESRRRRLSPINRVFRSKNVIAVLLAVSAQEILDGYESVLPRFREWFSVDLRSTNKYDPEFCKKFTEQVVRIYNVELSNSSNFSVFPKKVTREQPKIAIVFKKPIEQTDEVRVELKTGKQADFISQVKMENPHTTLLRIPDTLSPDREAIVDVSVFVNNVKIGGSRIKSELNARRMEDDDIDRMAQMLPPFLECLDNHIAETLLMHYKECTDYTADPELELMNGIIICKADILPTIMHFAAYYGLRKTAFTVLEEADGLPHCNIKNELDETPIDIALSRGHHEIGQLIEDYQEIYKSSKAIRFIQDILGNNVTHEANIDNEAGNSSNCNEYKASQRVYEELCTEQGELSKLNIDMKKAVEEKDLQTPEVPVSTQLSAVEPNLKSEDNEIAIQKEVPTPKTRRAKPANGPYRNVYVNDDGNSNENPETVQYRQKTTTKMTSPDTARKRFSVIEPNSNYDTPRPTNLDYQIPPSDPRPVTQPIPINANVPVLKKKKSGPILTDGDYLIMEEGIGASETETVVSAASTVTSKDNVKPVRIDSSHPIASSTTNSSANGAEVSSSKSLLSEIKNSRAGTNKTETFSLDPADEQLIGLINDFKNKTYDLKMVELLFENWKQRPDVQMSMKMKMEMVEKLREEYRKIQPKEPKKSVFDKLKSITSKRKKSTVQVPSISPTPEQREFPDMSTKDSTLSPTALTFTGPSLPPQTSHPLSTTVPSQSHHVVDRSRIISESSHRTSIDSRWSDSSVESDKAVSEASTNSSKAPAPLPPEYNNPASKRFISSYVYPNPLPQPNSESDESGICEVTSPTTGSFDSSYQVPPPPRPVKPTKKVNVEESNISPNIPRKPPAIPGDLIVSSDAPKTPPAVPAKSTPKYLGTESNSPPPVPPPRTNNAPNMFSYIDYKKKVQERNGTPSPPTVKKSYENMSGNGRIED